MVSSDCWANPWILEVFLTRYYCALIDPNFEVELGGGKGEGSGEGGSASPTRNFLKILSSKLKTGASEAQIAVPKVIFFYLKYLPHQCLTTHTVSKLSDPMWSTLDRIPINLSFFLIMGSPFYYQRP